MPKTGRAFVKERVIAEMAFPCSLLQWFGLGLLCRCIAGTMAEHVPQEIN